MSFTESVKTCFRKCIDFNGRAGRPEYWWFALFLFIVWLAVTLVTVAAFFLAFLEWTFVLVTLLPSLAVTVRRLHDTNRPAWWLLLLVPPVGFIGWIPLLILCVLPGTTGPNRYGPDPRQGTWASAGLGISGHPYAPPTTTVVRVEPGPDAQQSPSLPPQAGMQRRYCTQCGTQLQADSRFCTSCGTAV